MSRAAQKAHHFSTSGSEMTALLTSFHNAHPRGGACYAIEEEGLSTFKVHACCMKQHTAALETETSGLGKKDQVRCIVLGTRTCIRELGEGTD